jgi:hypothetical protein
MVSDGPAAVKVHVAHAPDAGGLAANGVQSGFLAEEYLIAHVRQLWYDAEHPNHYETDEPGGSLSP